ncbi:MAG: Ubiquinone/menaquinone biosynthesis C-methylase UbiE [Chloroflexi bacterium]|jgi:SAM-dependent methyltransferase|nr:MAG: Ubiquinone/menaquinone biosynthesis C-methylase UbiE [Chloroflexota bacterium]
MEYPGNSFDQEDESDDSLFYSEARLVVHIDDAAITQLKKYLFSQLRERCTLLDLMSSWRSHIPDGPTTLDLYGLGLNREEMSNNPQLDHSIIKDINNDPNLPYEDNKFDAAMVIVSIQYMTDPISVFSEVNRILKKDCKFHVVYSNRMFPTKATIIWKVFDNIERASLVGSYFAQSGSWSVPNAVDLSPVGDVTYDPLFVVSAQKK